LRLDTCALDISASRLDACQTPERPAMPRVQEGSFPSEAHGGVRIRTKAWLPDGLGADRLRAKVASPPSAVVLWSHGLHEHLGRFEKLYEALVEKNVAVYAWDHVGHGESGSCGPKRHQFPNGFDAVVADALQFARLVQSKYPKDTSERPPVPIFVGGVSFGGLVAAHVCANAVKYGVSVAGCVLVAPCCDVEWTPALRVQASIGSFLAKVAPDFRGAAAVTPERLSSDAVAIEEYRRDPLVRVANVRFKAAVEIMKGFEALRQDAFFDDAHFGNTPLLVMHGTNDAACHFPASATFVKRARCGDKTFRAIENGSHLLLHDAATATTTRDEICVFVRSRAEAFNASHSLGPRVASDSVGRALFASRQGAVTEAAETDIGARL